MFHNFDRDVERMMNCFGGGAFQSFPMLNNMLTPMDQMNHFGPVQNLLGLSSTMPGQNMSFSSSITTYSSNGTGKPQVYQATKSEVCGPNGFKETKETLKDSRTGVHQMKYGRHINDRAHIQQKKRNVYNGEEEEEDEFVNLDEEDADMFDNEFKQKRNDFRMNHMVGYHPFNNKNNLKLALTNGPTTSNYTLPTFEQNNKPISKIKKTKDIIEDKFKNQKNKLRKDRKRLPKF